MPARGVPSRGQPVGHLHLPGRRPAQGSGAGRQFRAVLPSASSTRPGLSRALTLCCRGKRNSLSSTQPCTASSLRSRKPPGPTAPGCFGCSGKYCPACLPAPRALVAHENQERRPDRFRCDKSSRYAWQGGRLGPHVRQSDATAPASEPGCRTNDPIPETIPTYLTAAGEVVRSRRSCRRRCSGRPRPARAARR